MRYLIERHRRELEEAKAKGEWCQCHDADMHQKISKILGSDALCLKCKKAIKPADAEKS